MHKNSLPSAPLSNTAPLYSSYTPSPHASPVAKTFAEGGGSECRALAKHSSAAYERIRTVGKGSFGIAVLYRRKDDDSFVILKEINLHELTPTERNMSLNEVALLSRLDHPHIIHYFDSFEEDGTLMIEMEYADGGTLAQLLAHRDDAQPLPEGEVVDIFEQMTSAVSYLHDNNILHRDLKTANIFLTKERMVKVGDFGVSKKLSTQTNIGGGAQTMLGTPYYLSPEMCEGRSYNAKSDMWAMGCCLYEMCTLRKPFDADNLTILIHKIINCEYEPLKGPYSQDIRLIVRELFRADPEQRPSASDLLEQIRRKNPLLNSTRRMKCLAAKAARSKRSSSQSSCYSALYRFDTEKFTLLAMSELPDRAQIKQIALSVTHQLVLTADEHVFSWGENGHGQLGHGDRRVRTGPTLIEALRGKGVSRVAAGKHFSLFCAGRGIAMAVGHRQFMGTAQADVDLLKPKIIEALLKEDIVDVCCGEEHATVLTESGAVFVWGVGENGRLGTGETANVFVPLRIQIPTRQLINSIVCGPKATMLITNTGTVLAMGSNMYNKLNLNQRSGFFANAKKSSSSTNGQKMYGVVDNVLTPTAVKPFPSRVVNASLGLWHSGVLLENGHVHLFGRNLAAELGHGNCQEMPAGCTCPVKALLSKACVHLVCGDGFTMAGTLDNKLYSWGMHKWAAEGQQPKENDGGADQSAKAAEDGAGGTSDCSYLSSTATSLTNSDGNTATPVEQPKQQKERKKRKKSKSTKTTVRHLFREPLQYEMSQTREGQLVRLKNRDDLMDKPKPFMMQPHLVLRLDICRKSFGSVSSPTATSSAPDPSGQLSPPSPSAHSTTSVAGKSQQPRLALSALVGTHSRVFCVVDVSTEPFPPATAQSGESDKKVAENSDRSRKVAPVPKVIDIRRSSAPDQSAMAQGTATWIREELESAEVIPYRKIANSDSICNSSALHRNLPKNAQRLREEIAALRSQLAEHKNTVRGHQSQMSQLQTKLAELESLLRRQHNSPGGLPPVNGPPPPAYSSAVSVPSPRSKSIASSGGEQCGQERKKLQSNSTTCAIL